MDASLVLVVKILVYGFAVNAQQDHVTLNLGVPSAVHVTECNQHKYFKVDAVEPCQDLRVQVTRLAGEPNLYISRSPNLYPSLRNLAWSSYNWGDDVITISSWQPDYRVGTFYVGVHAYCGSDVPTNFTAARYTVLAAQQSSTHPTHPDDLYGKTNQSRLAADGYDYYRFCVPRQCVRVNATIRHCMSPTAPGCGGKYGFPELLVSPSIQRPTVNDRTWLLGESSRRSIILDPSDPDFNPGHYYVSVYGWCTPSDQCPDRNTCGPCDLARQLQYTISVSPQDISSADCQRMLASRPKTGECVSRGQGLALSTVCILLTSVVSLFWLA